MNHLEGEKFGNLTVINYDKEQRKWKCKCDCGNITYVPTKNLKTGNTISCGCQQAGIGKKKTGSLKEKLTGKIIGQIKVLSINEKKEIAKIFCEECKKENILPLDKVLEMYRRKKVSYTCGINGCQYTRKNKQSEIYKNIKTGDRFGKLTVIERTENKISKTKNSFSSIPMFLCKCDCGEQVEVQARYLVNGNTKSCGCMKLGNFNAKTSYRYIKEQENGKELYDIYKRWKEKFRNPTPMFKKNVVDNGIKFFPELEGKEQPFRLFYQWATLNGFSKENKYLERKNYLKDFSSKNCFWTSIRTKGY